jgi:hypothetical protein
MNYLGQQRRFAVTGRGFNQSVAWRLLGDELGQVAPFMVTPNESLGVEGEDIVNVAAVIEPGVGGALINDFVPANEVAACLHTAPNKSTAAGVDANFAGLI